MTSSIINPKKRLASLDAFRGFTIAAMIIVNTPGSWDHVFPPLLHSHWNGITPTDLIFPFFLFIVGVSIVLAYSKKILSQPRPILLKHLFKRAALLFIIGVILNLIGSEFTSIRLPGVLQRISITFLVGALLFIYTKRRTQFYITGSLLLIYWALMKLVPVPDFGAGVLEPGKIWQTISIICLFHSRCTKATGIRKESYLQFQP